MTFLIVTGMSGAGKSTALGCLEDAGYYCVDNMPPELIPKFADLCAEQNTEVDKAAFGIDIRGRHFFPRFQQTVNELRETGYDVKVLFMEAGDEILMQRYKETRRRHPLIEEDTMAQIRPAIEKERRLLSGIKQNATYVLDTSGINIWQLKEQILRIFVENQDFKSLIVHISSFGFKYGIPTDSDLVFDVRFIPNPYYVAGMRELTGNDPQVRQYVMQWDEAREFLDRLMGLLRFLLPHYVKEGRSQLVISIGCTGGRHRSVTIANEVGQRLAEEGYSVYLHHREIDAKGVR